MRARLLTATAAIALTTVLTGCEAGADKTTAADAPAGTTQQKQDKPAAPAAKSEPTLTTAQKNAVKSAESYLETSAFSKSGLVKQLEFEDFASKDARFAVDSLTVDWKEEAAKSAASYLDTSSFSKSGLIDQLKFEGFTTEQAQYGAEKAYK